jgi:hypothetical protein
MQPEVADTQSDNISVKFDFHHPSVAQNTTPPSSSVCRQRAKGPENDPLESQLQRNCSSVYHKVSMNALANPRRSFLPFYWMKRILELADHSNHQLAQPLVYFPQELRVRTSSQLSSLSLQNASIITLLVLCQTCFCQDSLPFSVAMGSFLSASKFPSKPSPSQGDNSNS